MNNTDNIKKYAVAWDDLQSSISNSASKITPPEFTVFMHIPKCAG